MPLNPLPGRLFQERLWHPGYSPSRDPGDTPGGIHDLGPTIEEYTEGEEAEPDDEGGEALTHTHVHMQPLVRESPSVLDYVEAMQAQAARYFEKEVSIVMAHALCCTLVRACVVFALFERMWMTSAQGACYSEMCLNWEGDGH